MIGVFAIPRTGTGYIYEVFHDNGLLIDKIMARNFYEAYYKSIDEAWHIYYEGFRDDKTDLDTRRFGIYTAVTFDNIPDTSSMGV